MEWYKAQPTDNAIHNIQKPRLTAQILRQLDALKHNPTKDKLKHFEIVTQNLLANAISQVSINAYQAGAKAVEITPDLVIQLRVQRESIARARQAATWISATTGTALEITAAMSKTKALSEGRADLIAVNELAIAFFRGTRFGWGLDKHARKRWYVSDAHDKDDICDENEDDGAIGIHEPFTSGDMEPPAHIKCTCGVMLTRSPWPER